jgi:hypothetical protein
MGNPQPSPALAIVRMDAVHRPNGGGSVFTGLRYGRSFGETRRDVHMLKFVQTMTIRSVGEPAEGSLLCFELHCSFSRRCAPSGCTPTQNTFPHLCTNTMVGYGSAYTSSRPLQVYLFIYIYLRDEHRIAWKCSSVAFTHFMSVLYVKLYKHNFQQRISWLSHR